jgi:uncharacterized protein YbgA (DUF1722 family)/uncharacterized protein YbbK (DUF523 family)
MTEDDNEICIAVSACLLGEEVRYDGGHRRHSFVADDLARFVTLVPVCPEVELGLGVPRETIRLVDGGGIVRLRGTTSGDDHTRGMKQLGKRRAADLKKRDLCGYVFKARSPSCGLFRVPLHRDGKQPLRAGRGMFAEAVTSALPELPVEEEGRLDDAKLRETFVERVFGYARLRRAFKPRWRTRDLIEFHASEKLLLLAHRPAAYRSLGRLVARGAEIDRAELSTTYRTDYMAALAAPATIGRHVNVLQHIAGYFKRDLDAASREELARAIGDYGDGLVPLVVPATLLAFFARRFENEYLLSQSYLAPHPKELMLRNHV